MNDVQLFLHCQYAILRSILRFDIVPPVCVHNDPTTALHSTTTHNKQCHHLTMKPQNHKTYLVEYNSHHSTQRHKAAMHPQCNCMCSANDRERLHGLGALMMIGLATILLGSAFAQIHISGQCFLGFLLTYVDIVALVGTSARNAVLPVGSHADNAFWKSEKCVTACQANFNCKYALTGMHFISHYTLSSQPIHGFKFQ